MPIPGGHPRAVFGEPERSELPGGAYRIGHAQNEVVEVGNRGAVALREPERNVRRRVDDDTAVAARIAVRPRREAAGPRPLDRGTEIGNPEHDAIDHAPCTRAFALEHRHLPLAGIAPPDRPTFR